jgi:fermentation-respiration switch protein FrsA (DUF1100 family)
MAIILALLLIILGAGLAVVYLQVIQLTTPIRNRAIGSPGNRPYQDITLTTADGLKLSGWYLPGTRPEAIILVHGIHANRAYLLPQAEVLFQAGYHLVLFDLRGHGLSEGSMVTYGYSEALDVAAAVDFLAATPGVQRIGALGHSLGAAAVIHAAAKDTRLQALVIQSSYSSLNQVVRDSFNKFALLPQWPFAPLVLILAEFRTGAKTAAIDLVHDLATMPARPVLIIHAADDNLFPIRYAEEVYAAAQGFKELWLIEYAGGHVNPMMGHEAEYSQRVLRFFEKAFAQ